MLYIIRHAHAVDASENPQRPLSAKGREQCAQVAAFFRANDALSEVAEFWHSSLVRSRETATLLRDGLRLAAPLREVVGLESEDSPQLIAARVAVLNRSVALVGHEPHLSNLVSLLTAGASSPAIVDISKAAVLALEPNGNNRWVLAWHVAPSLLT